MSDTCFALYPDIFITKGYQRSIFYDSFSQIFVILNSDIANYIFLNKSCSSIYEISKISNQKSVETTIAELKKNGMITENNFTSFNYSYSTYSFPGYISNALIEFNKEFIHSYFILLEELGELGCHTIEVWIEKYNRAEFINFIEIVKDSKIKSLQLLFNDLIIFNEIEEFIKICPKITKIVLLSGKESTNGLQEIFSKNLTKVYLLDRSFKEIKMLCSKIFNPFNSKKSFFLESKIQNNCLSNKIYIDFYGKIKNCILSKNDYGTFEETNISNLVKSFEFRSIYAINKDQIDVCKDCEFRHMCMDCRAFIKDPENIYSQPAKCSYNPYICKWDGQEDYVPVEECGIYTRETGFVPDIEKINKFNKLIWGEDD